MHTARVDRGRNGKHALPPGVERHVYEAQGWGVAELLVQDGVVLAHDLLWLSGRGLLGPALDPASGPAPLGGDTRPPEVTLARELAPDRVGWVSDLVARFRRQLAGAAAISYDDVTVDLGWCTPFQAALAEALRAVPWGEVVSYGELAALAGRPGAARAAGSFCAQNRHWLIVPCHRVVGATGIGGYGELGVGFKRWLLALEGVEL